MYCNRNSVSSCHFVIVKQHKRQLVSIKLLIYDYYTNEAVKWSITGFSLSDPRLISGLGNNTSNCCNPFIFQAEGKKLGLVGWVQNTDAGTVRGQLQGPQSKVQEMQKWLRSTGSPKSQIIKAEFKNEKTVASLEHSSFNIVK